MRSKELTFPEDTRTFLVAGRQILRDIAKSQFDQVSDSIDELATETGLPLVALPHGFVAIMRADDKLGCVVGILAGRADNGYDSVVPSRLSHDDLLVAMEQARSLPWDKISERLPDLGWISEEVELHVQASGPLAGGWVGYGVLVDLRSAPPAGHDDDDDWDLDDTDDDDLDAADRFLARGIGPAGTVPGLELVRGKDMSQVSQNQAVYGVPLNQNTGFEGAPIVVDMSAEAHQTRVEALGVLADQSAYYLISDYD